MLQPMVTTDAGKEGDLKDGHGWLLYYEKIIPVKKASEDSDPLAGAGAFGSLRPTKG
jgi:hypothetical protein